MLNKFYFIAGSLATIALLTSLALINVPSSLILALAALSALALMLLYKIISRMENKFAEKERELKSEIISREKEELNNQLHRLTEEKEKWLNEELEKDHKERMLSSKYQELCSENERLRNNLQGQSFKMRRKLIELQNDSCELFFKFTVKEKLLKIMSEKKNARIEQLEKQLKEKDELCQEIRKISKNREMLNVKVEELRRKEDVLSNELSEQQYKVKEITKKNKYLSEELKKKFEELDKANGLIEDQFSELDKIRKNYSNEARSLKNLLLNRDGQIEQLQKKLKEVASFMQRCEIGETMSKSSIEAVLKELSSEMLRELEEKPSELEDSGYISSSPAPTKLVCVKHYKCLNRGCRM